MRERGHEDLNERDCALELLSLWSLVLRFGLGLGFPTDGMTRQTRPVQPVKFLTRVQKLGPPSVIFLLNFHRFDRVHPANSWPGYKFTQTGQIGKPTQDQFWPVFIPGTFHHLHGICGGLAKHGIAPSSRPDIHQWPIITLHGKTIELWHPFSITVAPSSHGLPACVTSTRCN